MLLFNRLTLLPPLSFLPLPPLHFSSSPPPHPCILPFLLPPPSSLALALCPQQVMPCSSPRPSHPPTPSMPTMRTGTTRSAPSLSPEEVMRKLRQELLQRQAECESSSGLDYVGPSELESYHSICPLESQVGGCMCSIPSMQNVCTSTLSFEWW